jgi:tripartite-type tricarboxylate transporter receptor subunit TctC
VIEAGYPGFEAFTLVGLNVPAGTPADVIVKLNQSVNVALGQPAVSSKMVAMIVEPVGGTPEAYENFLRKEFDKWGRVVREARITVE